MEFHQPVLLNEVLAVLNPQPGKVFLDATLGNGGHSLEILKRGGEVWGVDADPANLSLATDRITQLDLGKKFHPINANFSEINKIISSIPSPLSGLLADLGLSSNQQRGQNRGFSFNDNSSLDMRLDSSTENPSAEFIVNTYDASSLAQIFSKIAQEKLAKPIAYAIVNNRQKKRIHSAVYLADIVREVYQKHHLKSGIDPATKVFMALRIVVNHEYENLGILLNSSLQLNSGCTIAIITFHSGEDRIVKNFIRTHLVENLTPKGIKTTIAEINENPLSRSATLRSYKIK